MSFAQCRHSSEDSSAPSILLPQVRVPSTPSTLLSIYIWIESCGKDKNKQKEAGIGPFLKECALLSAPTMRSSQLKHDLIVNFQPQDLIVSDLTPFTTLDPARPKLPYRVRSWRSGTFPPSPTGWRQTRRSRPHARNRQHTLSKSPNLPPSARSRSASSAHGSGRRQVAQIRVLKCHRRD